MRQATWWPESPTPAAAPAPPAPASNWPEVGTDIVGLRIADDPQETPLVAVLCRNIEDSDLFGANHCIVYEVLSNSTISTDNDTNSEIGEALKALGGEWENECYSVFSIESTWSQGIRAVGCGSNIKKRQRAGRLALAVALACKMQAEVPAELRQIFCKAELALLMARHREPVKASEPPPPMPPPTATPAAAAPPPPRATQSAEPPPEGARQEVDPTAPQECLNDPAAELRPWANYGDIVYLWPYCTACDCWHDYVHYWGKRHKKALSSYAAPQKAADWLHSSTSSKMGSQATDFDQQAAPPPPPPPTGPPSREVQQPPPPPPRLPPQLPPGAAAVPLPSFGEARRSRGRAFQSPAAAGTSSARSADGLIYV